jgi:hypothetical protein
MVETVMIHGSAGQVLAPLGSPGTFVPGRRRNIRIVRVGTDESVPRSVREALVGVTVSAIFTGQEMRTYTSLKLDPDMMFAYAEDVDEILRAVGKQEAACDLRQVAPNRLDLYGFEAGCYETVD